MKISRRAPAALCAAAGLLLWTHGARAQETTGTTDEINAAGVASGPAEVQTTTTTTPAQTQTQTVVYAAPAPAPAPVEESLEGGWDKPFGVLFQLNNIFQEDDILSSYDRYGFGMQLNLAPIAALRFGLSLYRDVTPRRVTKNTTTIGADPVTTYTLNSPSASHSVSLGVDYLMRMGTGVLAPYFGAGPYVDYYRYTQNYEDDLTVADQTTTYKYRTNDFTLGLRGLFGIDWRVHKYFSFYAEYSLQVPVYEAHTYYNETTTEVTAGPATTSQTKSERKYSRYVNYYLDLNQGASFGLIAHF